MIEQKLEKPMTVNELAQITNRAFGALETSLEGKFAAVDEKFVTLRHDVQTDIRESEQRLLVVINRIDAKVSHLAAFERDVKDLPIRIGILEKKA
jgi:hypothetical protein